MCGIAGELCINSRSSGANWEHISSLMKRRGPDDAGLWCSPEQLCTLVFRRLAILDLSPTGHQPMVSEDGRYALVFNGEIYNFRELRKKLEANGATFRSTGDSEVVLRALIALGRDALELFNGMFALAFYDQLEQRLLIARDHAGIKPLYYLKTAKGVVFASQYDQILAHPWSQGLTVSHDALALYLRLSYIPAPFAILENTHMLEPGTWMEFRTDGQTRDGRYYNFPQYEAPSLSGNAAYEAVDHAITNAVKRQLVSDVPVAAFLSGGIDSPLITAKMLAASDSRIEAFTIGTGSDVTDESGDAAVYARQLGVKHVVEHVTSDQALEMLDDVITACGEPFGDYSIFPTMLVSQLASQGYKVILSGDGGDELFWGYTKRAATLIDAASGFKSPHWVRTARWGLKRLGLGNMPHILKHYPTLGNWQQDKHSHLSESRLGAIFPALPGWPARYQAFDYSGWESDKTAQWLRWNEFTSHLSMVLLKVDRASMFHSLEVRVPLLDREVISVATQVDWQSCLDIKNMRGKIPLRNSLARYTSHQTQGKRGFSVPMGAWLRTSLQSVFEQALLDRSDILGMEIDHKAMQKIYKQHLNGQAELAWGLWPLLSLSLWEQRHYQKQRMLPSA